MMLQQSAVRLTHFHYAVWLVVLALSGTLSCNAQQSNSLPRIGYLGAYPSANDLRFAAFRQQLRDLGQTEGTTVVIDYLSAEGQYSKLPSLATELARRHVNVIVADGGTAPTLAAMKATRTIPI